ncbi:M16 family metallopeptidase [Commensalibacter oyaizuii]|uniref:Pitrilysin family protein n=1 Tax=Commensalibacter oyaizuii TaxID=3043873 RepID=A0ABT6PY85_9PROT|nr:pitrilysin family protein [Commensalibacter sp. TBRC 16381]MDI2089822.1 pitrilysin family protein [Commensalibacter sp. TBRC 16381]
MKFTLGPTAFGLALLASTPLMSAISFPPHAMAQQTATSLTVKNSSHPDSSIIAKQDILRKTLNNGLRVVIIKDSLAPVVTAQISYLVGSNQAPKGFPGTAHALEHMMFRGSQGLDKDQLAVIGAQLGGSYNAFTTENVTQYYYTAPAEDLNVILKIEALRMGGLSLNAADWDKERGAIEQEVSRDLSNPIYKYVSELQKLMFDGTPYEHDALGTRPSFDKTTVSLLRKFYETYYAPNNAILVITGDIDPNKAVEQVEKDFGSIPKKTIPELESFTLKPIKAKTLTYPTDFPTSLVTIAWRMPGEKSKNFAVADILSDVISSQRGALYGLVPQGKALMADFEYVPKGEVGFGVAIAAFPKGQDYKPILNEVNQILQTIREKGVSPELVEAAKRKEIAQLAFSANSITGLASSWSTALAFQGLNDPNEMAAAYQAVTPEQVNALAKEILNPDEAITAILTPEDSGKPISNKGYGGAESFASVPEKPVQLPDWAQQALNKLNIPKEAPKPSEMVLSNGIRLIVQPLNVSNTISVFGQIRQNPSLQEGKGKEGIAGITNDMFKYGTKTLDRLAFRKAVDDIAADISAGSDFSLAVLTPDFDRAMQLLADNELNPAFEQKFFDIVKQQAAQSLIGLYQSPGYHFNRAIAKAINPPNDPSLRQPDPALVKKLTLQDLNDFYKKSFRPDLTTIVIAGNITPEQAKASVEKYFGNWENIGPKPNLDMPTRPDSKSSFVHVPDKTAVQNSVALVESINLDVHHPDHYLLNLGNEVLSGGFAGRFYKDLRVKTGYVYNVNSDFGWSRTRGSYSITFGADPDKVSLARKAALKDLTAMQTSPVTDNELQLAKASLLRSIPLQQASVDGIAGQYLTYTDLGLPLNSAHIAAKNYYKASAAEVQKAFQTYVRPKDLAEIIKGPATPTP